MLDIPNRPSPIDSAWPTRVPTALRPPTIEAERAAAMAAMAEKRDKKECEYVARPFRFEDLNGKPEPEKWGPVYPKTASAAVEKWRAIGRGRELTDAEKREHGAAVGEWIRNLNAIKPAPRVSLKYVMPDYAAKCRAAMHAAAAADRRQWAFGGAVGLSGLTIEQAYARAMDDKAARLADPEAYAAKLKATANIAPIGPKARARLRKLKAAA